MTDLKTLVQDSEPLIRNGLRSVAAGRRPPFRMSDLWNAPLSDLPIRDELIYQYLSTSNVTELLEIGPGTGFTAFYLSRLVKSMTIVDVASENISRLGQVLASVQNVNLVCADLCAPGLAANLNRQFDIVEAIEVFEFLPDAATALRNMGAVLRPGGLLFLQFPNYRPPRSHGVTYFERWADLRSLLQAAGFKNCEAYSLKLRPWADFFFRNLHERPLNIYRRIRQRERPSRPQTFDNVWTFRRGTRLQKYRCPIHMIWLMLMAACRLGGDCFMRTPLSDDIMDRNLLVIARR
jgi:SAM-dependent methyltransferase